MALIFKKKQQSVAIKIKSFTRDVWYAVNTELPFCTCPKFERSQTCKHLDALGLWTVKPYTSKKRPTFSQALCALVKGIRIRDLPETVYWLVYLNEPKNFPTEQPKAMKFRIARRLLIAGPEDGQSIAVMEKCTEHFWKLTKLETELVYLVAEAVRVCRLPNWWQDPGGQQYVHQSMVGCNQRMYAKKAKLESLMHQLTEAIDVQNMPEAIGLVSAFNSMPKIDFGPTKQAEFVLEIATKRQHELAQRLCKLHLRNKSALSGDNNFIAQAVWMLCGGETVLAEEAPTVLAGECYELIAQAQEAWKTPHPCPTWALDGIHCAGSDRRFMGMLPHMMQVVNAFKHYGKIDPADEWLPEFRCWDGLYVEQL